MKERSHHHAIAPLLTLTILLALTAIACAGQDHKIAFISDRDGNEETYIMNRDGSGLVQLTDNTSRDFAPHLAPLP